MTDGPYHIGETIILEAQFTDQDGTPLRITLPVTCRVRQPDNTVTTPTTTRVAANYQATFTPTVPGIHFYRFETDGAAGEGILLVNKPRVGA